MNHYLLSLGSNMGDRSVMLKKACLLLGQKGEISAESRIYETEPQDYTSQQTFLNMSLLYRSECSPQQLLQLICDVEQQLDRVRKIDKGPRTIDIDIILWQEGSVDQLDLTIPHPSMLKRRFVLVPSIEVVEKSTCFIEYIDIMKESEEALCNDGQHVEVYDETPIDG